MHCADRSVSIWGTPALRTAFQDFLEVWCCDDINASNPGG